RPLLKRPACCCRRRIMTRHRFTGFALLLLLPGIVRAGEDEDQAVRAIQKLGGEVTRDDKAPGKPVIAVRLFSGAPKFSSRNIDSDLKLLAPLKQLQKLDLSWQRVTAVGLKELAPLKQLQELELAFASTTDAGLKELASCKQLRVLKVSGEMLTDA